MLLQNFIMSLNKKQKLFLKWLIFCHLFGEKCENGYLPFHALNKKSKNHFGKIEWENLNELPILINDETKNDALQIKIGYHGSDFLWDFNDVNNHTINDYLVFNSISDAMRIIADLDKLVFIEIEESIAHVSSKYKVKCKLLKQLYKDLNTKTRFIRMLALHANIDVTIRC